MKAKEMFEELMYSKEEFDWVIIYHTRDLGLRRTVKICFDKIEKTYYAYNFFDHDRDIKYFYEISIAEFRAIHKQMQELRWLD